MKAYHVMMFLLIFNVMLWIITIGLGLYNLGYQLDYDIEDDDYGTVNETTKMQRKQNALLWRLTGQTIFMAVTAILAGAVIGSFFNIQRASQAYVYGAITSVFWTTYGSTFSVFYTISSSVPGGIIILILFTAIIAYVFLVGLFQMVTGGWKSYV